jgi:uncharacterized membrane protein YgdD (TMEM256/DUF423 family)
MIRNRHNYFALGAFMLGVAVILGAMGAHGLEKKITPHYLATWKTATEYLVYNALALMAFASYKSNYKPVGNHSEVQHHEPSKLPLRLFIHAAIVGVFVFSISIYIVSLNELYGAHLRKFGMIAPIGGTLMAAGWIGVGAYFLTHKHPK